MKPMLRNGTYHLVRRVPRRYARVEARGQVWISLNTDSENEAEKKLSVAWEGMLRSWEARLKGDTSDAEKQYEAAVDIAKAHGFRYLPAAEVAKLPVDEIIARVSAGHDKKGRPVVSDALALLGASPKPEITVSDALDLYWGIADDRTLNKSKDQIRRWENPRKKAVANFVRVIGDLALSEITPDEMQDFRDWWLGRIREEGLKPNSANKDLVHLSDIVGTVNKAKRLGLNMPVKGWAIKEGEKNTRPPFSVEWIRTKIMAPDALAGMNKDARCLVLGMINTGYRPSEAACMGKAQIRLDANIPHISIEPVGRTLKSAYARRVIPLLGISLEAFRECPEGFPRYDDSASLSAVVNKFFETNGLKETPTHTLYSLRHSFQDRMIAARIDDRIRRDLFGHALTEEKYGDGASLEMKRDLMLPLAL